MAAVCFIDRLPVKLLEDILSRLSWQQQLGVRSVSRCWRAAAESCLARRQELHVTGQREIRGFETLLSLLHSMPALRRACFDKVPLDPVTVERLCESCPLLEQVSLKVKWDVSVVNEASVETLLRRLPGLRLLDVIWPCPTVGFLRLLPEGLHTLALQVHELLDPALLMHLKRCSQLRDLTLSGELDDEQLTAALASVPQLEVLAVIISDDWPPSMALDWTHVLADCPRLWSLHICSGQYKELDLPGLLNACRRLERLLLQGVALPASTLCRSSLDHEPRLSHMDLTDDGLCDDDTFWLLPELLPGLKHLCLETNQEVTEAGLARGLWFLTSLEVLELHDVGLEAVDPVLDALGGLPLKALSIREVNEDTYTGGLRRFGREVTAVFRRCPTLTMLRLQEIEVDSFRALVDDLTRHPSQRGEVTLFVPRVVSCEVVELPRNVRVVEDKTEVWERLTGWSRARCCSCSDR